ncbi:DUF4214 domain-containing protein [Aquihabitans daechungensis]|uniref:DUF4214 domain-containing protein n=1 Tax=Aquihabitans daechungensis TaxID=1052257 RepID=UPI003BA061DF
MRARSIAAAIAVGTTAVVVGPLAEPAGAAVTAAGVGTLVNVTVTGNEAINFTCPGGNLTIQATSGNVAVSPAKTCAEVTQITVTGDGGNQSVYGAALDGSAFAAHPRLVTQLNDGDDYASETLQQDNLTLGQGNDRVDLKVGSVNNNPISLDIGDDTAVVYGTPLADTMVGTSVDGTANVATTNASGVTSSSFTGAEHLRISSDSGNDTITTTGITAASTIVDAIIEGGPGNDTITDGVLRTNLFGGPGTNSLTGGPGQDAYWTESHTDSLDGGNDAADEYVYDGVGLRSGGRSLTGFTATDNYVVQAHEGDVTMRIRPGSGSTTLFTTSLTRTGQQVIPAAIGRVSAGQAYVGALPHRGLVDVVATDDQINATLPSTGGGLIDITIPTGAFTPQLIGNELLVTSSFGQINASYVDDADHYRVHGPWTNKDQGYAHRVVRDLLFRFPSDFERDVVRDQITNGIKTRAGVAQAYMGSDEYRGLDVDRVFLEYLRRVSDPGGRTYWIKSLRNGKALWRFRAQLFGSNEYFTKAGGTNASYVTKAYADVLGRAPDASGQTYWTNKLNNGADRGSVALQFINSPEARRRVVDDQFLRFLDRLPVAEEQANWVAALPTVNGEQALIAALVASAAYYDRS